MAASVVASVALPISNNFSFAPSMDVYGKLSDYGRISTDIDAAIMALFANNEVGAFFDPSDLSTMFQDSAGTIPVTGDGQPVGKILDKSGRGNHATQATAASRPLYKTDGTYHWLQFDGVDDSLSTAPIDFTGTDKMSVFHGINVTSSSATGTIAQLGGKYNANGFNHQSPTSAGNTRIGFDIGGASGSTNRPIANYSRSVVSWLINRAGVTISDEHGLDQVNGVPVTNVFGGVPVTGNFGNLSLSLSSTAEFFNGSMFSFIVRGALSTTDEITATETWVNQRTGAY